LCLSALNHVFVTDYILVISVGTLPLVHLQMMLGHVNEFAYVHTLELLSDLTEFYLKDPY